MCDGCVGERSMCVGRSVHSSGEKSVCRRWGGGGGGVGQRVRRRVGRSICAGRSVHSSGEKGYVECVSRVGMRRGMGRREGRVWSLFVYVSQVDQ